MLYCFNPHTHEGCDGKLLISPTAKISFNPHTHEGCDMILCVTRICTSSFNPHTHEGCDDTCTITISFSNGFNPHTHEGCDPDEEVRLQTQQVSIHTPTKGVTQDCVICKRSDMFQSTHPRRVWRFIILNKLTPINVSIHTPTKGVTHGWSNEWWYYRCFNPHTHEGCDAYW